MAIILDALMMMMMMKTMLLHKNPSWQLLPLTPKNPRPPQVDSNRASDPNAICLPPQHLRISWWEDSKLNVISPQSLNVTNSTFVPYFL
jgi:hypothetical protein